MKGIERNQQEAEDCRNIAGNPAPARRKKTVGLSREGIAYWKKALRKCSRTGNFTVQIFYGGRRGTFTFGRNAEVAAEKARQAFLCMASHGAEGAEEGWLEAISRFSPSAAARVKRRAAAAAELAHETAVAGRIENPTVGDVIQVASEFSTVRPATFHGYAKALRFMTAEIFGISHAKEPEVEPAGTNTPRRAKDMRHDYRAGGLAKWRAQVEAIPIARLSPDLLQSWRKAYLGRAGTDPAKLDRARVSFNKTLRNAKALFAKKTLAFVKNRLILPEPLFFENARMESEPPMRYRSKIDPASMLQDALDELSLSEPETYKALFLCLVLGLRRNEADTLLWSHVDLERDEVALAPTEHNQLKSRDSARAIALDRASLLILRGWKEKGKGSFVLESSIKARPMAKTPVYRCKATFNKLAEWLRSKGITAQKPIHELRKECGTLRLKQGQSIETVSRYLGHTTIQVTMKHYADIAKQRATVNLAALMAK